MELLTPEEDDMLKYKLVDGEMVESEEGNYVLTADLRALSIGLKSLEDRIKDFSVMYPVNSHNNEIFRDILFLIDEVSGKL